MKRIVTIITASVVILSCKLGDKNNSPENNIVEPIATPMVNNGTVVQRLDKSLLNGVWAENIDDNALFYIENDSIHYFDSTNQPAYFIDLSDDVLSIYYDDITFRGKVLKLSNDSLVYENEKKKMKLYKRKE